ncbi:MAG TPA: MarR family transcriptional regulator [Chloroflexia bacterium]|nr:MarR family transcriptional regulator [Chloroflexia bacterium]
MVDDRPIGTDDLVTLLGLAFRAAVDELHSHLAAAGYGDIRPAHGFAFKCLAPDGASGNELAAYLGISKQAASQMVDYLVQHGYVVRQPHPRDGRGRIVVLTARGWACIRTVEAIFATLEQEWAQQLGAGRMATLRADLYRLGAQEEGGPRRLRPVW